MADRTNKKLSSEQIPLSGAAVFNLPEPPAAKAEDYLKSYKSWVYKAVYYRSNKIAEMQLKLYKKKRKRGEISTEEILEHEILSVLAHANSYTTFNQLIAITSTFMDLMGEAFWILIKKGSKITEIIPVRPDWMEVKPGGKDIVQGYVLNPARSGKGSFIDAKDVIHFKEPNPLNLYRGKGAVQALDYTLDINTYLQEWQRAFFFNSAMPSIVFSTDQKLSKEQIDRFTTAWETKFMGPKKSNQIAFLSGGLKPNIINANIKEMCLLELSEWERDDILSGFGVSKANLGIIEDVNRANQEASDYRFLRDVVKPRMRSITEYINEFLVTQFDDSGSLFLDFVDPLPPDTAKEIEYINSGIQNYWMTINEARATRNLPPVEGGDVIYKPLTFQPLGEVLEPIKSLLGKSKEEGKMLIMKILPTKYQPKHNVRLPVKTLAQLRQEKEDANLKEVIKDGFKENIAQILIKSLELQKDEESQEIFWKDMVASTNIWEARMFEMLKELLFTQEGEVLQNIESNKSFSKAAIKRIVEKGELSSYLFNTKEEEKKWRKILVPFILMIINERGKQVLEWLGVDVVLSAGTRTVEDFFQTDGTKFLTDVNITTREHLKESLREGLNNGESSEQLSRRVKEVYTEAADNRAAMIARTETLRSTNFATNEAYIQSGVVKGKKWLTATDERRCEWCKSMEGKVVGLEETYFDKGDKLNINGSELKFEDYAVGTPPLHPFCRCTLVPVLTSSKQIKKDLSEPRPIKELRANHARLKSMQKEEERLEKSLKDLEDNIKQKKDELDNELDKIKKDVKEKAMKDAEQEKINILADLNRLRTRAEQLLATNE